MLLTVTTNITDSELLSVFCVRASTGSSLLKEDHVSGGLMGSDWILTYSFSAYPEEAQGSWKFPENKSQCNEYMAVGALKSVVYCNTPPQDKKSNLYSQISAFQRHQVSPGIKLLQEFRRAADR